MKNFAPFILILLGTACSKISNDKPQMPPLKLSVVTTQQKNLAHTQSFTTQTQPLNNYVIQPRVAGFLQNITYAAGAAVRKGDKLFVIDPAPLQADLARQQAQLASAKAQLTQATNQYNRNVPLARINAVSQSQLDASKAELEAAKQSVAAALAVVRSAKLSLGYTTITAPGDGIIAQTSAVEGDYVGPGTEFDVLTTIADNDSIVADLALPTKLYYQIVGEKKLSGDSLLSNIELILPNGTAYSQKGKYRFTKQNIDPKSGSIIFEVAFDNKQGVLRAGEFVRINVNMGTPSQKILIPQICVDQKQGLYNVWVVLPDNTVQYRAVVVGHTFDNLWEIKQGLNPGEKVATEGFAKLRDGMKVEPIEK